MKIDQLFVIVSNLSLLPCIYYSWLYCTWFESMILSQMLIISLCYHGHVKGFLSLDCMYARFTFTCVFMFAFLKEAETRHQIFVFLLPFNCFHNQKNLSLRTLLSLLLHLVLLVVYYQSERQQWHEILLPCTCTVVSFVFFSFAAKYKKMKRLVPYNLIHGCWHIIGSISIYLTLSNVHRQSKIIDRNG